MIRRNYNSQTVTNEKDLRNIVNDSLRLTFFRTILTTLTTIIPVIALIFFGSSEILNFNLALLIGFIAGVFSSIYISNQLWLLIEIKRLNRPKKEDKHEIEELQVKGINC